MTKSKIQFHDKFIINLILLHKNKKNLLMRIRFFSPRSLTPKFCWCRHYLIQHHHFVKYWYPILISNSAYQTMNIILDSQRLSRKLPLHFSSKFEVSLTFLWAFTVCTSSSRCYSFNFVKNKIFLSSEK